MIIFAPQTKNRIIMSIHEQEALKERYYGEAIRYMNNAKECE